MNESLAGCVTALLVAVGLSGCASVPDVRYRYFGTTWSTTVQVVMTVGCVAEPGRPAGAQAVRVVALYAPSVTTTYERDPALVMSLDIRQLSRYAADVDTAMTLTEDGRLESFNQSTTGTGMDVIKSVVGLSTSLAGVAKPALLGGMFYRSTLADPRDQAALRTACATLAAWTGDASKPVPLTYRATVNAQSLVDAPRFIDLKASPESSSLAALVKGSLPTLSVKVDAAKPLQTGPVMNAASADDAVLINLQKAATADLLVRSSDEKEPIAQSTITFPTGELYQLPIPRAALFGGQKFGLKLSPAGAVTTVSYGRTSGLADSINAFNEVAKTQTAATEAAALKAQIDLINNQKELWKLLAAQP